MSQGEAKISRGRPIGGKLTDEERKVREERRKRYQREYYLKRKALKTAELDKVPSQEQSSEKLPSDKSIIDRTQEIIEHYDISKESTITFTLEELLEMMVHLATTKR